jgi:hypothetical protein
MTGSRGPRTARERWLRAGVALGMAMVIVPFLASLIGIARVSGGPEGLRGATHRPEIRKQVGFALGSTSLLALLALPGVLLAVLSALTLAEDQKKIREQERENAPSDDPTRN